MLKINLLPQEYRKAEGTPFGVLMVILLCTLLSVSSLSCVAWLYFSMLKEAEMSRQIAKEEMDNLAPQAKYADALEKEKQEYMKRSMVIKDIESTRILWTKKLDQLLDVIYNNGDVKSHWVWLDEVKINMKNSGGNKRGGELSGGSLKMKGYTVGEQIKQVSEFNRHLKEHDLFEEDFIRISNPTGETIFDDKMIPSAAFAFDWELTLKHRSAQSKAKKKK